MSLVAQRTGPLRIGIVGAGNVAVYGHIPAYLEQPDLFEIVALADPTPDRLAIAGDLLGLAPDDRHLDPADLIARSDVDVVDVCTPQHLHRDIAIAAIGAGKHVLCEKPLATTPRDAAAIVRAASDADVTLGVVHNYLFRPEVEAALATVRSGRIGRFEVAILNYLGVLDLPGNAAFRPSWRHDPRAAGGGVLMDMLHIVYVAEALLDAPIERVSAYVSARALDARVEDLALCRFETSDGVALVNMGWGMGPGGIEVSGTEGRLTIRFQGGGTSPFVPIESVTVVDRDGSHPVVFGEERNGLAQLLADFGQAVAEQREPRATGAGAVRTLEATLAAYVSGATGRTVELPFAPEDPVYELGVVGVSDLDLPAWSPVRRGLFTSSKWSVR